VRRLLRISGEGDIKADQRLFCLFLLERWQRQWVDAAVEPPARAVVPH
jgi:hypothetical protein